MNDRMKQIIDDLKGIGPNPHQLYTNQEIVDRLRGLITAIKEDMFEKTHAENLHDQDILTHLEALAKERGLGISDTYSRFQKNMKDLNYTIGTLTKGMKGEQLAKRALKLLNYEKGVRILYNVQLEDADTQAEYDAIVIAPYGLFVIEVKNWGTAMTISPAGLLTRDDIDSVVYDLPGRMSIKEALLREHLQELFPESYHSLLMLPNERTQLKDEYHKIFIRCGSGIAYDIKSFSNTDHSMSEEQVNKIADTLLSHHKEQRKPCRVNCDEIIFDYAALMSRIESATAYIKDEHCASTLSQDPSQSTPAKDTPATKGKNIPWGTVITGIVTVAIPGVVTAIARRRR